MAFKYKISSLIKQRMKSFKYTKLERTLSQEELENGRNESLEQRISEGMKNGSIVIILPAPLCRNCQKKV